MSDSSIRPTVFSCYPIRCTPIIQERIWGGDKLKSLLNKDLGSIENAGESWEISTVEGNVSVISNGLLQGLSLKVALELFGEEIMGREVVRLFGTNFPLLIKFLHSKDDLSIQVHPNDELAKRRHDSFGKTEMWYVLDAEKGSKIISGFNQKISKEEYVKRVKECTLPDVLDSLTTIPGDTFFIPTGRIHALGAGVVLAEVQQTSDITYRIYDYGRKDKNGKTRELHTELALESIDFSVNKNLNKHVEPIPNEPTEIISCAYFTTNILLIEDSQHFDLSERNCFTIYICVEGYGTLNYKRHSEIINMGETLLLPATLNNFTLSPSSKNFKLLEVFI